MKKLLLPLILALLGGGGGVGAGIFLGGGGAAEEETSPATGEAAGEEEEGAAAHQGGEASDEAAEAEGAHGGGSDDAASGGGSFEYVKLPQQFVVPVIADDRVRALVVVSLSLEVTQGATQSVFAVEPKLRDAFLEAMFTHAHSGGFDGNFTTGPAMADFRHALNTAADEVLGEIVHDVLVTDIVRQDS